jgi:hypothetical protein
MAWHIRRQEGLVPGRFNPSEVKMEITVSIIEKLVDK